MLLLVAAGLAIALVAGGYNLYHQLIAPNTPDRMDNPVLLIPSRSTFEDIVDSLKVNHQILHEGSFRRTARLMRYDDKAIRAGRYVIPARAGNRAILSLLRGGNQTPLALTIQNVRTMDQLCGRVASKLEFDSMQLSLYLQNSFDSIAGTIPETRMTRFIPNTYEFYWTVRPEEFCKRMLKEYSRFWTEERKAKAAAAGLTPEQVYTLASILEKETNYNAEKPRMAGVYLNRLKAGMPLQADPTIVFALGDFELRRVLYGHLSVDSPYNTYLHTGLPPGPIFMPGLASIEAVLDAEHHDYLFFCARPMDEGPGHAYAATLSAHNENARRYQAWLDREGYQ